MKDGRHRRDLSDMSARGMTPGCCASRSSTPVTFDLRWSSTLRISTFAEGGAMNDGACDAIAKAPAFAVGVEVARDLENLQVTAARYHVASRLDARSVALIRDANAAACRSPARSRPAHLASDRRGVRALRHADQGHAAAAHRPGIQERCSRGSPRHDSCIATRPRRRTRRQKDVRVRVLGAWMLARDRVAEHPRLSC